MVADPPAAPPPAPPSALPAHGAQKDEPRPPSKRRNASEPKRRPPPPTSLPNNVIATLSSSLSSQQLSGGSLGSSGAGSGNTVRPATFIRQGQGHHPHLNPSHVPTPISQSLRTHDATTPYTSTIHPCPPPPPSVPSSYNTAPGPSTQFRFYLPPSDEPGIGDPTGCVSLSSHRPSARVAGQRNAPMAVFADTKSPKRAAKGKRPRSGAGQQDAGTYLPQPPSSDIQRGSMAGYRVGHPLRERNEALAVLPVQPSTVNTSIYPLRGKHLSIPQGIFLPPTTLPSLCT